MRSRGIHPGLVCYLNHSASHAGAVTSIGRGHCMIRDSPGSISTRQTSRFFGVFAFFGPSVYIPISLMSIVTMPST